MVSSKGVQTNLKIFLMLSVLTGAFIGIGYYLGGTLGMVAGLFFAGIMNFGSYWFSDRIVLKMYGAEELPENEFPEIHKAVEKLSNNAGIPKPRVYRNDMKVPNAFATGRSPEKGVVCLTDGLMNQLEQDEIEGVIAHELAHIKNRDSLINAVVATLAGAIAVIARIAFYGAMFSGNRQRGQMVGALAFMILTPIIAILIKTAISRQMEFRADRDAVKFHRSKQGLSNALKKISSANKKSNMKGSQVKEAGSNLFIENPFSGDKMTKYFSTHPPLDERLENINDTKV